MNRKTAALFLSAIAVVCIVGSIAQISLGGYFTSVAAFPLEQLGMALRSLSLSGASGNIAALFTYWAVGLLPMGLLGVISKKRKLVAEDSLLALLSVLVLIALYQMTNPGIIASVYTVDLLAGKAALGITVYSVLVGYVVLRLMRRFSAGDEDNLTKYMTALLFIMAALFVYAAFGSCFSQLLEAFASLSAGNRGNEHLLGPSYVFLVLNYFVDAIPYALNALVALSAMGLVSKLRHGEPAQTLTAAKNMALLCVKALSITVLCNTLFNVAQLAFSDRLLVINSSINIPVMSITFVLAALLLTRLVAENKRLQDDNDMFI